MSYEPNLKDVEKFWSANPCGSDNSILAERKAYFNEIERKRYDFIRHIPIIARFNEFTNKKVLEVGCGVGTDGRQFAKNGAIYTGINLDEGSVSLAKEAFLVFGLSGEIRKMNAEQMEFENAIFDHIYSCGVIHHSPNTEKIVSEMFRVLKPGGTIHVMIYNRTSINYYFEIMFLRKIFRYLLLPPTAPKIISTITGFSEYKLRRHQEILTGEHMNKQKWLSINTDGPDCPLAKVYSKQEAQKLFENSGFKDIVNYVRFFDKSHYSHLGKLIPDSFAEQIGKLFGWCRWIEARKPPAC
ncbi:class I SAM-dependent methyltransferase [Trichlorobacter lovleyi]|uniref:class I SAM-dependent methyltransferase n=1 Tax=Trichlorobacter lovleyi TaxID=313985 RepID=UPI00223FF6D3|nr:class I SAM-dependent methyltransferase [Trichlorobacter lovleyi]QOX78545.1 class I SAM-dependent methyltransferase [Trichlorobacter lovleyi]